jgi:hypothetical protein
MTNPMLDNQLIAGLCEPFHPMLVEWKPQAISKDGKRALAVAYIDARHYQHRLDQVVPGWQPEYEFIKPDGSLVICRLTVLGVTREEVGESDPGDDNTATSAVAQSFKRACTAFGIGRYLYFLPQVWCEYDSQSRRIASPPALPAWAKPGGGAFPLATKKNGRAPHTASTAAETDDDDAEAEAVGQDNPENGDGWMSQDEARSVIFTLKPKNRPELTGKSLGEVAEQAPNVLHWLAEEYSPTPKTQHLRLAARILQGENHSGN